MLILNILFFFFVLFFLISVSYFHNGTKEARKFDSKNKTLIRENDKKGILFLGISLITLLLEFIIDKFI